MAVLQTTPEPRTKIWQKVWPTLKQDGIFRQSSVSIEVSSN